MKNNVHPAIRFIIALIVLGGLIFVFTWSNCNDKKSYTQDTEEDECKGGPSDVKHGDLIEWDTITSYPQKEETVTFEGFAVMPNLTYLNGGTYLVNLTRDSTLNGDYVTMMIYEGDCENTMAPIPEEYDDSDLLIYDNSGKEIHHGDKVRVTGKVWDNRMLYIFKVKRIEKLE